MTLHSPRTTSVVAADARSVGPNPPQTTQECEERHDEIVATPSARRPVRPCAHDATMLQLVYHALDRQLEALDREVRRASTNGITVDGVHAMRTGSRRIRATLKIFREMLPNDDRRHLSDEVAWLARELGSVRDLDVQCATLARDAAAAGEPDAARSIEGYARRIADERDAAARELLQTLQGARVDALLADFHAFLDREPSAGAVRRWASLGAREGAEQFAERALRRIRKYGRRVGRGASAPEQMHDLRIRCKRFRYLLESCEPICGDRLELPIRLTRRLQDTLGRYQDARIAIDRLTRELAAARDTGNDEAAAPIVALLEVREREASLAMSAFHESWQEFQARVKKRRLRKRMRGARH